MTGQDVVNSALRLLDVLDPQETPSVSESTDVFARLNDMLDSWSLERLNVVSVQTQTIALAAGQSSYVLGTRPLKIESANVFFTQASSGRTYHFPVELIDSGDWSALMFKGDGAAQPEKAYCDKAFPSSTVNLYPTPNAAGRTLELYVWSVLPQFPDLATDVAFAPGYARAIRYNLAIEIAGEFAAMPSETVVEIAKESKAALRMLNVSLAGKAPDSGPLNAIPTN